MPLRYLRNLFFLFLLGFSLQQCSSLGAAERASSIQSGLENDPNLSTFTSLVQRVGGMDELLTYPNRKHTFFVPTNEAFDILGQRLIDNMSLPDNRDVLLGVLQSHVAEEVYSADAISKAERPLMSIFDTPIDLANNSAQILYSIKARDGMIHVIDKVIQR